MDDLERELQSLPVERLIKLNGRLDSLIAEKLRDEKQAILEKLRLINRYEAAADQPKQEATKQVQGHKNPPKKRARSKRKAGKVPPKYRDPKSGATWARPRHATTMVSRSDGSRQESRRVCHSSVNFR